MNLNQKIAICCTLAGMLLVILFPPFHVKMLGVVAQNGHHFITAPPNPLAKVDVASVVIRCLVIAIAGAAATVALSSRKK